MSCPLQAAFLQISIYSDTADGEINPDCQEFDCRRGQIATAIFEGILNYVKGPEAKKV